LELGIRLWRRYPHLTSGEQAPRPSGRVCGPAAFKERYPLAKREWLNAIQIEYDEDEQKFDDGFQKRTKQSTTLQASFWSAARIYVVFSLFDLGCA